MIDIFIDRYLVPLFKWQLCILPIKQVVSIFIVNFKVLHINLDVALPGCLTINQTSSLNLLLRYSPINETKSSRNDASVVPGVAPAHGVSFARASLAVNEYSSIVSLEAVLDDGPGHDLEDI